MPQAPVNFRPWCVSSVSRGPFQEKQRRPLLVFIRSGLHETHDAGWSNSRCESHSSLERPQSSWFDVRRLIGQPQSRRHVHHETQGVSVLDLRHAHALDVPLRTALQLILNQHKPHIYIESVSGILILTSTISAHLILINHVITRVWPENMMIDQTTQDELFMTQAERTNITAHPEAKLMNPN